MTTPLIAIEGIDGAGKSTLVEDLKHRLPNANFTSEPNEALQSGIWLRKQISRDLPAEMDVLMFAAHHSDVMWRYAPTQGCDAYISDRSSHVSMYAYQAHRLQDSMSFDGAPWEWIGSVMAPIGRRPDHVIQLDVDLDTAVDRCSGDEKFERRGELEKTRAAYERMPGHLPFDPEWHRVDAAGTEAETLERALDVVEGLGAEVEL